MATWSRSSKPNVTWSPSLTPQPAKSKATSVAPTDAAVARSGERTAARRPREGWREAFAPVGEVHAARVTGDPRFRGSDVAPKRRAR